MKETKLDPSLKLPEKSTSTRMKRASFTAPKENFTTYTVTVDDTLIGIAYYHHMR